MTPKPPDLYEAEEIAAERLIEQGEAGFEDRCDLLDAVGDGELADQLVTAWLDEPGPPSCPEPGHRATATKDSLI